MADNAVRFLAKIVLSISVLVISTEVYRILETCKIMQLTLKIIAEHFIIQHTVTHC